MTNIILAAGLASRAHGSKLFWEWDGEPLIRHTVRTSLDAGLDTLVVTGFRDDEVRRVLSGLPVRFVTNERYAQGQAGSVRRGVGALDPSACGPFFLTLGDMPLLEKEHYRLLAGAWDRKADGIRPVVGGVIGHPVLLSPRLIPAIVHAPQGMRMKDLLAGCTIQPYPSADPAFVTDVDTEAAYRKLKEETQKRRPTPKGGAPL